jgi:ribonuclease HI
MTERFYAVAVGRVPGIYSNWPEAKKQIEGFAGAVHKKFASHTEADAWLKNPPQYQGGRQQTAPMAEVATEMDGMDVVIHTDGSCLGNPGPGGYGAIIRENGQERQLSGGFRHTTNNRMEIMAAIIALTTTAAGENTIHLYSDSSYLVNAIEKGWAKNWARRGWRKADGQPALNADLWRELLALLAERKVVCHWLRGHAGHRDNERCDQLALLAAQSANLSEDTGYQMENRL